MPNIILKEEDWTKVAVAIAPTDVAFVPGIADRNFNCYICRLPDVEPPASGLQGTVYVDGDTIHKKVSGRKGRPSLFVNTFDKRIWKCTGEGEWTEMTKSAYVAPSPMNAPTFVNATKDFDEIFGASAFKWTVANYEDAQAFNKARELPIFKENELPGKANAIHYFYNEGDEEISWAYAKDLIYNGMPVYFEDIAHIVTVELGDDQVCYRRSVEDVTVQDIYDALNSINTGKPSGNEDVTHGVYTNYELRDLGEFRFKYVTSGGYPVFNALVLAPQNEEITITSTDETNHYVTYRVEGVKEVTSINVVTVVGSHTYNNAYEIVSENPVADESCAVEIDADGIKVTFANADTLFVENNKVDINFVTNADSEEAQIVNNMLKLCAERGDCYAIIDHADNVLRPWYGSQSLFEAVQEAGIGKDGTRGCMFTPWATYTIDVENKVRLMPPSFGYLRTLANGIKNYNSYFAFAGVNRGGVYGIKELHCIYPLTNTVANELQTKSGYSINPITFVRPYGLTIWGNRTLLEANGLKAGNFLNIRNLACEIQKTAYNAAKVCLFENDTLATWVKFTNPINELLLSMQNAGSLKAFSVNRIPNDEKALIEAEILVVPIYATEEFIITTKLLDDGTVTVDTE